MPDPDIDTLHAALKAIPAAWADPPAATLSKLPKGKGNGNNAKCDTCGGFHAGGMFHLDYMGHADVRLALIDIDPFWTWEPLGYTSEGLPAITKEGNLYVLWGKMTVLGKTMVGVGTCETGKGEPQKELIGDLIRNIAMSYGLATKLWSKAPGGGVTADPFGSDEGGGYDRHARSEEPAASGDLPLDKQAAMLFSKLSPDDKKRVTALAKEVGISNVMKSGDNAPILLELMGAPVAAEPEEDF